MAKNENVNATESVESKLDETKSVATKPNKTKSTTTKSVEVKDEGVQAVEEPSVKYEDGKYIAAPGVILTDGDRGNLRFTDRIPHHIVDIKEGSWLYCQLEAGLIVKYV